MAVSPGRAATRAELARAPYDLLVIGSGIIGAGLANEAARAGLRVALVDRADFASATSSGSSKLIHGGLRYLRLGDVKLVREAHTERRALLRVVAPHLVRRIPFLFPVYRGGPYRPATIQAGLWTYSTLAGEKLGGLVRPERARRSVPGLRLDGLRGCGVYQDAWTHDGRLCLANVTAAAEAGATVLSYAEVVGLRMVDGVVCGAELRDRLSSEEISVEARAVVNATGPWLDELRRLEDPGVQPYGQLSKGVHVTLPLEEPWSSALTIPHDQRLKGHSDADVALHALTDALLATCGAGDIGDHFPPSDPQWTGAASRIFLEHAAKIVRDHGGTIMNADVSLIAEAPKIGPHRESMRKMLAEMLDIELERCSVKATTNEKIGFVGRGEGIAAIATATVVYGRKPQ